MKEPISPEYLNPGRFVDSDHPEVMEFADKAIAGLDDVREKVMALYYAVRDGILYDPYHLVLNPDQIKASLTLQRGSGYCVEKSLLLAAAGRHLGIPSRLGFSIVRNHLSSEKFRQKLKTDIFVFHGYNEFLIGDRWVKCTPAFNKSLCEKMGAAPLEFNGTDDSLFQEYNGGVQYMEYLHQYGVFSDFPYELFVDELKKHYPHFFEKKTEAITTEHG